MSKRFAENLLHAALPAYFSWHSDGRRKALASRRCPRATAAKKNDATALPQQDAVRLLQDAAQLEFCPAHLFFNEGTKILHKNCLPVSSYIVTFVSPNKPLNFTYDEF
ncbi:MAG: hypothetical protein UDM12_07805 [Prevotellamassilia sp.]|nr:hypothetical protein [Prevotellamassilia sp.]